MATQRFSKLLFELLRGMQNSDSKHRCIAVSNDFKNKS